MKTASGSENVQSYYQKAIILINENKLYFLTGVLLLLTISHLLLIQLGDDVYGQIGSSINRKFENLTANKPSFSDTSISKKLSNIPIDSTSPTPSEMLSSESSVTGQISAIQTDQVTFKGNKYTVQLGDSLAGIAERAYGDRESWLRIFNANNIASPDMIEVGMVLNIPR